MKQRLLPVFFVVTESGSYGRRSGRDIKKLASTETLKLMGSLHSWNEGFDLFSFLKMIQFHLHNPPMSNLHQQLWIIIFIGKKKRRTIALHYSPWPRFLLHTFSGFFPSFLLARSLLFYSQGLSLFKITSIISARDYSIRPESHLIYSTRSAKNIH